MAIRITNPAMDPALSLSDARTAARANGTELDAELQMLVAALAAEAEHCTGCVFINRTYRVTHDAFPAFFQMPANPVQTVVAVNYIDIDGVQRELAPSLYRLDESVKPARLVPVPGAAWPQTADVMDAVTVDVICGYGSDEASTPPAVKLFISARITDHYRTDGKPESPVLIRLLDSVKVY